MAFFEENFMTF